MRFTMKKLLVAILGATFLLSGCTTRIADLTVGSTKNYNINSNKFVKGKRVSAEDTVPVIIVPAGIPNLKTAFDRAIEQDECAVALSDVVIYRLDHSFLLGSVGYRVEGTQVLDRNLPECK